MAKTVGLAALVCVAWPARAERHVLRLATAAPDGTHWAREMKAVARQIESETRGEVRVRWYFGGIAGDELGSAERVRRGQLDGVASGGVLCQQLAPSMRVLALPGMVQGQSESAYVVNRLKETFDAEFTRAGFVNLGSFGVGPNIVFSREPVRTFSDLRAAKLWVWKLDEVQVEAMLAMGMHAVPLQLEEAGRSFERRGIDAFAAVPAAALAFQWSTQAHYVTDLRMTYRIGCMVISQRALDTIPLEAQRVVRAAVGKGAHRMEELGREMDEALLGGLFARQGLKTIPVAEGLRSEFFDAARRARTQMGDRLVPRPLLARVSTLLADYRAEHPSEVGER